MIRRFCWLVSVEEVFACVVFNICQSLETVNSIHTNYSQQYFVKVLATELRRYAVLVVHESCIHLCCTRTTKSHNPTQCVNVTLSNLVKYGVRKIQRTRYSRSRCPSLLVFYNFNEYFMPYAARTGWRKILHALVHWELLKVLCDYAYITAVSFEFTLFLFSKLYERKFYKGIQQCKKRRWTITESTSIEKQNRCCNLFRGISKCENASTASWPKRYLFQTASQITTRFKNSL